MTVELKIALHLHFLARAVHKECKRSPPQISVCLGTRLLWRKQLGLKKPPDLADRAKDIVGKLGRFHFVPLSGASQTQLNTSFQGK